MQLSIKMISIYPLGITNYKFISTHYDIKKLCLCALVIQQCVQLISVFFFFFLTSNSGTGQYFELVWQVGLLLYQQILNSTITSLNKKEG